MSADFTRAACDCGCVDLAVAAPPLFRILCHCTICQRFNSAACADICVLRARDVDLTAAADVRFDTYRPPPNVMRGKCPQCDRPALEVFRAPLLPDLVMIPARNFGRPDRLTPPVAHLFYEHRVQDVDDDLPRYTGYPSSQFAFMRRLFVAMLRSHRAGRR